MVREDLVEGAVSFLQDPSVASAPLEQRIAFLRSKNLTQDEIDASLARVGQSPTAANSQTPPIQYRQPQPQYNGYQQQQYGYPSQWHQPPELPRRDWRDYFIAATVLGGVGYGFYWTAKRYIYPLIAPPTPPQLEQDKESLDASFEKAFALLDQLATDTKELKDAEAMRKERLDAALTEVESVISRMKLANEDRELEAKRMAREITELREQIPKAIEKEKETTDNRLKDLNGEMKSLKTLVANRMQGNGTPARTTPSFSTQSQQQSIPAAVPPGSGPVNGVPSNSSSAQDPSNMSSQTIANATDLGAISGYANPNDRSSSLPYSTTTSREGGSTAQSRLLSGKAAIPSWQLAAKKKTDDAKENNAFGEVSTPTSTVHESGTATDVVEGLA